MNILDIEKSRIELNQILPVTFSYKKKLLKISAYLSLILKSGNNSIFEAYFTEYLELYLSCLKHYSPWYFPPSVTDTIMLQVQTIIDSNYIPKLKEQLRSEKERIASEQKILLKVLSGELLSDKTDRYLFPVIDTNRNEENKTVLGILESITVSIKPIKGVTANKFIVIPSEPVLEERIGQQIEDSWSVAINEVKKHIRKIGKYHEAIISFDKKEGYYEGNSLGIVLTLAFIKELHSFYNSRYQIRSSKRIALTGSVNAVGEINSVSKSIIEEKVEVIFYSDTELFILPEKDETFAKAKNDELKSLYPGRRLKILGVSDISDVINRRDIVNIKKQNLFVKSSKDVIRNWKVSLLIAFLLSAFSYFLIGDLDDNPASVTFDGSKIYIKNAKGRVLWDKNYILSKMLVLDVNFHKRLYKIVDADKDGKNEVLLTGQHMEQFNNSFDDGCIACFSYRGNLLWKYSFREAVMTCRDTFTSKYSLSIVDTTSLKHRKVVVLFTSHSMYYPYAFIKLDLKTGEKLQGELWHSGHMLSAIIKDIDNDGIPELIAGGCNNGYKRACLAIVKLNQMDGILPSTREKTFLNKKAAKYEKYILLPRSDYNKLVYYLNSVPYNYLFDVKGEKIIQFGTEEGVDQERSCILYWFNYSFNSVNIIFGDQFVYKRDILVDKGLLSKPYTGAKEYYNTIRNSIDSVRYEDFLKEFERR